MSHWGSVMFGCSLSVDGLAVIAVDWLVIAIEAANDVLCINRSAATGVTAYVSFARTNTDFHTGFGGGWHNGQRECNGRERG